MEGSPIIEGLNQSMSQDFCMIEKCLVKNISDHISVAELQYFDIAFWTLAVLMVVLGLPLNLGILNYEWYGGDPQKRSLVNRTISSLMIVNFIAGISFHIFTGIVRYNISTAVLKVAMFKFYIGTWFALMFYANTVTFVRFSQVVVWKRVMEINEDLACRAINRAVIIMGYSLGWLCHPEFKFYGIMSVIQGYQADMHLSACKDDIDPLHQKFSVRLMVGGSISIHTIAHLAMRHYRKRYQVTPQILHDLDTSKPLRQSRHNKSILSQNSVWQFLVFFFLVVTILLAFGSAKAGQTMKQMWLWSMLGPMHVFVAQFYLYVLNKEAWESMKRAFKNILPKPQIQTNS